MKGSHATPTRTGDLLSLPFQFIDLPMTMCVSYGSRYNTLSNIHFPHCTEAFTRDLLIGQSIIGHKFTRTCLEQGCVRSFHERQKQTESEMKGLILIRLAIVTDCNRYQNHMTFTFPLLVTLKTRSQDRSYRNEI